MPYCPNCRGEFREGIGVCGECKVSLVESLDDENEIEELEVVCNVVQEENAYIIQGFLLSEGIPCQIENATFHAAPTGAMTEVRLWTKKTDAKQARTLIEEHEQTNVCSSCGHVALAKDTECDFCNEKFDE